MRQLVSWFLLLFLFVFPTLIVGSGEITFPSLYSVCVPGFECSVTWTSQSSVGNIKIEVYRDDWGSDPLIATVTSSTTTRSLTWIPSDMSKITMSDQYYYRATSLLNAALNGESSKFTIQSVAVYTNITHGGTINAGSAFTVYIEAINIGSTSLSPSVTIGIYQDVPVLIDPLISNEVILPRTTKSYMWTIPVDFTNQDINNCYIRITHTYGGTPTEYDSPKRFKIIAPPRTLTATLALLLSNDAYVCVPGYPCSVSWFASPTASIGGITVDLYRYRPILSNIFITTLATASTASSLTWTPLAGTYTTGEYYYFRLSGNGVNYETASFQLRGLQIQTPVTGAVYALGDFVNVTWISSPALANSLLPIRVFRSDNWAADAKFGGGNAYGRVGYKTLHISPTAASNTAQYYIQITYTTDGTEYTQESSLFTIKGPTSLYPSCSCECPSGGLLFSDTCKCSIAQTCPSTSTSTSTSAPPTSSSTSCCTGASVCDVETSISIGDSLYCCPNGGTMSGFNNGGGCDCGKIQTCPASSTPTSSSTSPTTTVTSTSGSVPADTCCRGSSACSGASMTQTINSVIMCCPQGGAMTSYNNDCNCGGTAQACNGPITTATATAAPTTKTTATATATASPTAVPTTPGTNYNGASNGAGGNNSNNISQSSSSSSTLPIAIGAAVGGLALLAAIVAGIWWRSRRGTKVFVAEGAGAGAGAAGPQKNAQLPRQSLQPIQVPPHYQKQIDDSMAKIPV